MNRRQCCMLLGATLLRSGRGHAAGEQLALYPSRRLTQEAPRLERRIGEICQVLTGLLIRNGVSPTQQRILAGLRLDFPLADDSSLMNFSSRRTKFESLMTMPVLSLLFLEDLCTAAAWLTRHGYSLQTIDQYLAMLQYKPVAEWPGNRFPPPLEALHVPPGAAEDQDAGPLGVRLRNSAYAFILAHEIGHLVLEHPGYDQVSREQARRNEAEADRFALRALALASVIPMGAVLYFQSQAYMSPNPGLYAALGRSRADWDAAMRGSITHPLSADRLRAIGLALYDQASQASAAAERDTLRFIAVRLGGMAEILADTDLQHCMAVAARRADMADLLPQRLGPSDRFLGKCVRRN